MATVRWTATLLVAAMWVGCSDGTGPEGPQPEMGVIQGMVGAEALVTVPTVVKAGEDFQVAVRTYGRNSCWSMYDTQVSRKGSVVTVTPRDLNEDSLHPGCFSMVVEFDHTATLRFGAPGYRQIVVRGRDSELDLTLDIITDVTVTQ